MFYIHNALLGFHHGHLNSINLGGLGVFRVGSSFGPNFIALLNGKQIFVLTIAEKIA